MARVTLTAMLCLMTLTGCARPRQGDVAAIAEQYSHRHQGECSSWLYSYATQFPYCASPKIDVELELIPVVKEAEPEGAETLADLRTRGEKVYGTVCAACHQADGKGVEGTYPPLAGSGAFYGDAQNMSRIIVHGLNGEIVVQGKTFNGAMPPQGHLSDYEIAAVATFVRTSFGNDDGIVKKADVAAVR
ncbi:MAG: cytochrome c [Myxococcales bacterium]|nr:cytochrome c [Myxococcales bacterium]MCB9673181.1 cytochrome c [Alphaproteobacteria bacterium]MCB9693363.1 cytochrome c [Alphaproteobacteria bacterium]